MSKPREIRSTHHEWSAVWYGGPYIEVFHASRPGYPLDAINVWDYETDRHRLSEVPAAHQSEVHAKLVEWAVDSAEVTLEHVLPYLPR